MSKFDNLAAYISDMKGGIAHFKSIQTSHNKAAHFCAVASMALFLKDGNLESAKQFRETLDTNGKQNQFVKWVCDMSGVVGKSTVIQFTDKKFTKNPEATDEHMAAINIAALETGETFLKYKQEAIVNTYNAETIRDKVLSTVKRVLTNDRSVAVNDEHRKWVEELQSNIKKLFADSPCPAIPVEKVATAS